LFIGEAPGENENRERRPFIGRAGKLLDKLIESIHLKRADVYITNIVKRRPPGNRDPLPEEILLYKPYLARQIRILQPKIIIALGRFSMNYFVPDAKISRDHGKIYKFKNILFMPVYHPAAALRGAVSYTDLEHDFKKIPKILKEYEKLIQKPTEEQKTEKTKQNSLFQEKGK
jgi:DNA polymerase